MTTSNDPDQIRAEIERTRSSLSSNVNALAYEAKPSTMAKRKVGKVSGAVTGLRERVMGSAQESTSTISDSAQSAMSIGDRVRAVRAYRCAQAGARQPSRSRARRLRCRAGGGCADPASEKEQQAAVAVKDKAQPLQQEMTDVAKDAAQNLKEPAQQAAQAVKDTATDAAATVKEEGTSAAQDVQDHAQDAKQTVQDHQR